MKGLITSVLLTAGTMLLLSGCVGHVSERKGMEIQVVPVTYAVGISIKKGKEQEARQQLDEYVHTHWGKVTMKTVNLLWYTKPGKKLADSYARYLLKQGVDKNKVWVKEASPGSGKVPFDLKFETVVNRTVVEVCEYEKIGKFGMLKDGCYSDGARWQSMVNPEKMLIEKQ